MNEWLPITCNWIHTLVVSLPKPAESYVLCDSTSNEDQFWFPGVRKAPQRSRLERVCYKWLRRMSLGPLHGRGAFGPDLARATGADILHSHFGFRGWEDVGTATACKLPHVVSFYGADAWQLPHRDIRWRMRYRYLFQRASLVLCEGPYMARRLKELGCPASKVQVHHLAVNLEKIQFRPRVWRPGSPLKILIAGTFTEKKGIPYSLEAAARLVKHLDVRISIFGDANQAPGQLREKERILDTVRRLDLGKRVVFHGYKDRATLLREAYSHDVFLCTSVTARNGDAEGGAPVVLLDMAATGMPIVSTTHCDIPEVIEPDTGMLAGERDVDGLVERLEWLVSHPDSWLPLCTRLRSHVEDQFEAATQGRRLLAIYEGLISNGARRAGL